MSQKFKRIFGIFTVVFIIGTCIALPLATYMILNYIDPQTHFYYDNATMVPYINIFYVFITVVMVAPILFPRAGSHALPCAKHPLLAITAALSAVTLCISSAYEFYDLMIRNATVGNMFTSIFGFLSSIFFFVLARNYLTGKKNDMRVLALLPVIWSIIELIVTFMSLTQIANISQYLFKILQMVFAVLFLYYNARYVGGMTNRREINGIFAFGLPCAFYGLLTSMPNIVAYFIEPSKGSLPAIEDFAFMVLTLYIIALIVVTLRQKSDTAAEAAELPQTSEHEEEPDSLENDSIDDKPSSDDN